MKILITLRKAEGREPAKEWSKLFKEIEALTNKYPEISGLDMK